MVHIDLEQVRRLRGQVELAAGGMDKHNPAVPSVGRVASTAFGNTSGSGLCSEAWHATSAEAQVAFDYLRISLQVDAQRLGVVVREFMRHDDEAADDIVAAAMRGNSLDVYNTHVAAGNDDAAEQLRSDQLGRSVDHIESMRPDPAIFVGDFNVAAPPAVDRLQGWTDASSNAQGELVETRPGQTIDKVYVSPGVVVTDPARSIDGGPSDHDGLVIDVGIPPGWP